MSSSSFHAGLTIYTQRGRTEAEAVSPWNPRSHHEVAAALAVALVAALALAAWSTTMAAGTTVPGIGAGTGEYPASWHGHSAAYKYPCTSPDLGFDPVQLWRCDCGLSCPLRCLHFSMSLAVLLCF